MMTWSQVLKWACRRSQHAQCSRWCLPAHRGLKHRAQIRPTTRASAEAGSDPAAGPRVSPPAIYIQKYGRVMDLVHLPLSPPDPDSQSVQGQSTTPHPDPQHREAIEAVLEAVQRSPSYEKLVERLRAPSSGLFDPPVQASIPIPKSIFVDEEKIAPASEENRLKLASDPQAVDQLKYVRMRYRWRQLPQYYLMLSKSRLTLLVCATAAGGYAIAPGPFVWSAFIMTTAGTALFSCSANAINQFLEVPFDSQMNRTKNRVLVRGHLSGLHAFGFAMGTGAVGLALLGGGVNATAACLGLGNLVLYTCVYTPLKRVSILNTWVGSVVGAIPPLIGWAGCTGGLEPGALVLAGILYAWQFPHFNSLSWNLRPDYSKAGYRMMSVTQPDLCRRVALRHALGCIAICTAAPWLEVTDPLFALDSLPLNLGLTYLAWQFYRQADSASSRRLFRYTLIHLPLLMALMFISKKRSAGDEETPSPAA